MMSLKQAKRWYEFAVGQITEDIDGTLCIRTLNGKLWPIPYKEIPWGDCRGCLCTFWINKKSKTVKNIGVASKEPLTEANVMFVWDINFGEL